jgi:hypothetical protein
MTDLLIYESGNGGEVEIVGADLATTDSLANQVYLAHFGGNVEANTTGEEIPGEDRFDWWGNIFFESEPDAMMNSSLERTLNSVSLGSYGRTEIEGKAIEDVQFLKNISEVEVSAAIVGNDKAEIIDYLSEIDTAYQYLWNGTKDELIVSKII